MAGKLIAFVVPLGLDTFAVCAAIGARGLVPGRRLRVSLVMTVFETGMPLVGLVLGTPLGRLVGDAADGIAVGTLLAFGLYTLIDGGDGEDASVGKLVNATGWGALVLGLSISLDELAVGFTLGLLGLPSLLVVAAIGAQAFVVSQLGLRIGTRIASEVREGAERLAGLALIGLGLWLLLSSYVLR
jgi:putative Mn2+ efflux pump MntP